MTHDSSPSNPLTSSDVAVLPARKRRSGNKTGRHKPGPAPMMSDFKMRAVIFKLAKQGRSERGIYLRLGISGPTWLALKERDAKLLAALESGQEAFHDTMVDDLRRHSRKGIVAATIFALKCRGWNELGTPLNLGPRITINLPGSLQLEKLIGSGTPLVEEGMVIPALPVSADVE